MGMDQSENCSGDLYLLIFFYFFSELKKNEDINKKNPKILIVNKKFTFITLQEIVHRTGI